MEMRNFINILENVWSDDHEDIREYCELLGIESYQINSDNSIDVFEDIDLTEVEFVNQRISMNFHIVEGFFDCNNTNLATLENSPKIIRKTGNSWFNCSNTDITSLKYAPIECGGNFYCSGTKIRSFDFCPKIILGNLYCSDTHISDPLAYIKLLTINFVGNLITNKPRIDAIMNQPRTSSRDKLAIISQLKELALRSRQEI